MNPHKIEKIKPSFPFQTYPFYVTIPLCALNLFFREERKNKWKENLLLSQWWWEAKAIKMIEWNKYFAKGQS